MHEKNKDGNVFQRMAAMLAGLVLCLSGAAVNANPTSKPIRLAALGDSLTAGYMLKASEAFPVVLAGELKAKGYDVVIDNFGISGDTTAGGLSRIGPVLASKPDGLILELGANDGLMGLDPAHIEQNLENIIAAFEAQGVPVLLTGMKSLAGMGRAYSEEYSALFLRLATRHGLVFYPFFLEGVAGVPELCMYDGVHPTAAGIRAIAARILPVAVEFLESAPMKAKRAN